MYTRNCRFCDIEFTTDNPLRMYCSENCRKLRNNKVKQQPVKKCNCLMCNELFTSEGQHRRRKYCSSVCLEIANKQKITESQLSKRINFTQKYIWQRTKNRAQAGNIEFSISEQDLELPVYCPIFGYELEYYNKERTDKSATVDRIDNNKGYVPGNVRVISWGANRKKHTLLYWQIERLYKYIKNEI